MRSGLGLTVHAGEWTQTIDNVKYGITQLGARRIGHGIVLGEHPEVMALAKQHGVTVEVRQTLRGLSGPPR